MVFNYVPTTVGHRGDAGDPIFSSYSFHYSFNFQNHVLCHTKRKKALVYPRMCTYFYEMKFFSVLHPLHRAAVNGQTPARYQTRIQSILLRYLNTRISNKAMAHQLFFNCCNAQNQAPQVGGNLVNLQPRIFHHAQHVLIPHAPLPHGRHRASGDILIPTQHRG